METVSKEIFMKLLFASIFTLTLLGTTAASADLLGVGVHIGGVGADAHIGGGYHHHQPMRRVMSLQPSGGSLSPASPLLPRPA